MRIPAETFDGPVLAQACAWLLRLQDDSRSPATEADFRSWLADNPAHAQAFARVSETWDIIPGASRFDSMAPHTMHAPRKPRRAQAMALAACAALLALLVGFAGFRWSGTRHPVYRTVAGEQQTWTLEDGTRVTLNTDTQLSVAYLPGERLILLDHGEAMFEVARNPQRPFLVRAGQHQVRALGTTFDVRSESNKLAVMLIEGRVEISQNHPAQATTSLAPTLLSPTVLSSGERLVLQPSTQAVLDHPDLDQLIAWRHGNAIFNDVPLVEAVGELNRYGNISLRLGDPALGQLRVSGVFSTHDPIEFANAIAALHHLSVTHSGTLVMLEHR